MESFVHGLLDVRKQSDKNSLVPNTINNIPFSKHDSGRNKSARERDLDLNPRMPGVLQSKNAAVMASAVKSMSHLL